MSSEATAAETKETFRVYPQDENNGIVKFYKENHQKQTFAYVKEAKKKLFERLYERKGPQHEMSVYVFYNQILVNF